MRIIKATPGFIIDMQNAVDKPIICVNKKELHSKIDEIFPEDD